MKGLARPAVIMQFNYQIQLSALWSRQRLIQLQLATSHYKFAYEIYWLVATNNNRLHHYKSYMSDSH